MRLAFLLTENELTNTAATNALLALLGYLYKDVDAGKAAAYYRQAIALTQSAMKRKQLQKAVERLHQETEKACPAG